VRAAIEARPKDDDLFDVVFARSAEQLVVDEARPRNARGAGAGPESVEGGENIIRSENRK
jgi:hypothetical protein